MSREYKSICAIMETRDFLIAHGIEHGILRLDELKDVDSYRFDTDISRDPRLTQTAVNGEYAEFLRTSVKKACKEINKLRHRMKGVHDRDTPVSKYLSGVASEVNRAWSDFVGNSYSLGTIDVSMDGRSSCEATSYWRGSNRINAVVPSTWNRKVRANGLSHFVNSGEKAFVLDARPVDNLLADEHDAQLFFVKAFGKLSEPTLSSWMNRIIRSWEPEDGDFSEVISGHQIMNFIRDKFPHDPPAKTPDDFTWYVKDGHGPAIYSAYMARSNMNGYVGSGMTAKAAIKLMDRRNVKGFIDQLRD